MVSFRPVTETDLPMLANWLARPHWQQWWGDPATELGYIEDMVEGRDTTQPSIFQVDGEDKGYIQVWFVGDQQETKWVEDYPWLNLLSGDTVGVDLSIADAQELSQGLGTKVLKAFVQNLRSEGYSEIIIDPDPSNHRAVHAYQNAGFIAMDELAGKTGDSLLMKHHMNVDTA